VYCFVCVAFLAATKKKEKERNGKGGVLSCMEHIHLLLLYYTPVHAIHFYFVDVLRCCWQLDWIGRTNRRVSVCHSPIVQFKQNKTQGEHAGRGHFVHSHLCHESRETGERFLEVTATMVAAVCILFEFISSPFILRSQGEVSQGRLRSLAVVSEIEAW
jgi:hypothetical protein